MDPVTRILQSRWVGKFPTGDRRDRGKGFTLASGDPPPQEVSPLDVEADLNQIGDALVEDHSELAREIQKGIREALRWGTPESILAAVQEVLKRHYNDLVALLARSGAAAGLLGLARLASTIPPPAVLTAPSDVAPATPVVEGGGAAQELVEDSVEILHRQRMLLPAQVQRRIDRAQASARQIAQAQAQNAEQVLRDTLAETVAEGGTVKEFRGKVKEVLGEKSFLADRHVENVFRSNVLEAYSQARLEMVQDDPQVADLYPYAAYHATHDDRTRPEHKAMEKFGLDGTNIYRANDPVFRKFRPPWDFSCRCLWTPCSVEQAAKAGVLEARRWLETGKPPAMPQHVAVPDFSPSPGFVRDLGAEEAGGMVVGAKDPVELLLSVDSLCGIDLAWERDGEYRGKSGGKWVGVGEDEGKVRYQKSEPGKQKPSQQQGKKMPSGNARVHNVPTSRLSIDPERFQYKLRTDASGVTEELKGVTAFNPLFAGVLAVWKDPKDGRTYVVNGHHRYELARRLGHPNLAVRYVQAASDREARAIGAMVNIAEGRGTALDAAKFLRDSGLAVTDLASVGVSLKGKVAEDAAALSRLNDRLFARVVRGSLSEASGLAVARHLEDPDLQDQLFGLAEKQAAAGKPVNNSTLGEMAREMVQTPAVQSVQKDLFGASASTQSLFVEKNELKAYIRGQLARDATDYAVVASARRAEHVQGAGNVLNVEENQLRAAAAEQAKATYDTLVNRKGAISEAINQAVIEYQAARGREDRDAARQKAVAAVRAAIERETNTSGAGSGAEASGEPAQVAGGDASANDAGRGDSEPGGLIEKALQRYDERGSLRGESGSLFGGDDLRSRERFAKLPSGTPVVVTEGPNRGKPGRLIREKSLDGSERITLLLDGEEATIPVAPDAIEPLNDLLSWRTEGGAAPGRQAGLFNTYDPLPKKRDLGFSLAWEPVASRSAHQKWVGTGTDAGKSPRYLPQGVDPNRAGGAPAEDQTKPRKKLDLSGLPWKPLGGASGVLAATINGHEILAKPMKVDERGAEQEVEISRLLRAVGLSAPRTQVITDPATRKAIDARAGEGAIVMERLPGRALTAKDLDDPKILEQVAGNVLAGYVLGDADRHVDNFLLDGEKVHAIDFENSHMTDSTDPADTHKLNAELRLKPASQIPVPRTVLLAIIQKAKVFQAHADASAYQGLRGDGKRLNGQSAGPAVAKRLATLRKLAAQPGKLTWQDLIDAHKRGRDLGFSLAWEKVPSKSENQKWVGVGDDEGRKAKYLPKNVDPNKAKKPRVAKAPAASKKAKSPRERSANGSRSARRPTPKPTGKLLYSGVVLDTSSRKNLLSRFQQLIPAGWKESAHHMTTAFGKALPPGLLNRKGQLRVTHVGIDHKLGVMAVKVESDIPSENAIPHITIAVAPHGQARFSNQITDWKPVSDRLVLTGTAQDVHATERTLSPMQKQKRQDALSYLEEAQRLRQSGDTARAGDLERRAAQLDPTARIKKEGQTVPGPNLNELRKDLLQQINTDAVSGDEDEDAVPAPVQEDYRKPLVPQKSDPGAHRVASRTPREADLRMRAHLDAWVDRKQLRKYGGDMESGIGLHGKQAVYPINGKLYVVDVSKPDSDTHTRKLREVQPAEVKLSRPVK